MSSKQRHSCIYLKSKPPVNHQPRKTGDEHTLMFEKCINKLNFMKVNKNVINIII